MNGERRSEVKKAKDRLMTENSLPEKKILSRPFSSQFLNDARARWLVNSNKSEIIKIQNIKNYKHKEMLIE